LKAKGPEVHPPVLFAFPACSPEPKARPDPAGFFIFSSGKETKRMSSEAQIRANQENARKSTGPTSVTGKARVAQNARKHGFSSREVMITCPEDADAFNELVADYGAQYPFQHAQRPHLIATMANAEMQIRLISRAKIGAMQFYNDGIVNQLWGTSAMPEDAAQLYNVATEFLGLAFLRDAYAENVMLKLNRYEAEQQRIWNRAARQIEQLYFKWKDIPVPEPVEIQQEPPEQPVIETKPISQPEIGEKQPPTPEIDPKITPAIQQEEPKGGPNHPKAA